MKQSFVWLFLLGFVGLATLASGKAVAQITDCSVLDAATCLLSPDCMFAVDNDRKSTACVAPWTRCQIGFRQEILDGDAQGAAARCSSRVGCAFLPAAPCDCQPGADCACDVASPPDCRAEAVGAVAPPLGRFVIVDVRAASGVTSGGMAIDSGSLGETVELSETGFVSEGIACDRWEISRTDLGPDLRDPLLADVMVGPAASPLSAGDQRILAGWEYACEGEVFTQILQIDARVIVISWQNGERNLIAEVPLGEDELRRFQAALKDKTLLEQDPTGSLDDATLLAMGLWADYRVDAAEGYRFARPALTLNLLDTLGVFE